MESTTSGRPKKRNITASADDTSPFVLSSTIVQKLMVLDYERNFLRKRKFLPFSVYYFAVPARNPQEQFYQMSSLFEWLSDKAGWSYPSKAALDDDSNTRSNLIIQKLREADFPHDYAVTQIKQAYGESVCYALNWLCDLCLSKQDLKPRNPRFPKASDVEDMVVTDDDGEDDDQGDMSDEDMVDDDDDPNALMPPSLDDDEEKKKKKKDDEDGEKAGFGDSDDDYFGFGEKKSQKKETKQQWKWEEGMSAKAGGPQGGLRPFAPKSHFSQADWQIEVEKMASQLRVRRNMTQSQKDWFAQLEESKENLKNLMEIRKGVMKQLGKVVREVQGEVEKVKSRERFFNQDCKDLLDDFRTHNDDLRKVTDRTQELDRDIQTMTTELAETTETVETLKGEMEMYGEQVGNTQPLIRLKQAQTKLQEEIKQINVRIGTLQHYLLQTQVVELEEKKTRQNTAANARRGSTVVQSEEDDDDSEDDIITIMPLPPLHQELQSALEKVRHARDFKPEEWLLAKANLLNDYMKKSGLKGLVINMSGGVDSSCVAAICLYAQKLEGSPIERVVGVAQPIHSTASIQSRADEVAKSIGLELITVDQTPVFDQLLQITESSLKLEGNEFSRGQLRSYMRTPVAYYVAQVLSSTAKIPSVVVGTGNKDEDGYLYYFCKAGDGISDIQLIADLHKSEVFAVSRFLKLPDSVLNSPPSADLWEGQTDEEEIGCSYDFVELFTEILGMSEIDSSSLMSTLGPDSMAEFTRLGTLIEGIHKRNKHKEVYPLDLNVL
ncbi:putative Intraflagellar transport protein 57 like protein [Blattamonas nauphoetae]|uniref:Intraflagellar transport protein 57 like protein n=1 Tax=Blattamonas nauphoetae TaxID=2049346 RepID=A0ABQ9XT83_9EUKA|nr:putative Intraflagellar transport protein 57 like protein [Blattamonas nauphoetae]